MEYRVEDNDLRDLLKVGYKVKTTATQAIIKNQTELNDVKRNFNENLDLRDNSIGLIAIYRPKYNGVKPMEWELVWERKEPKYYLRSWIEDDGYILDSVFKSEENYLNFNVDSKTLFIADCKDIGSSKTQFTQEEIDNLPNQDFIKTLVKEEVK